MKAFFLSYLLLPLLAIFAAESPFEIQFASQSMHLAVLLGGYYLLPIIICYLLIRRSALVLPALIAQLLCVSADVFVAHNGSQDQATTRLVLVGFLLFIGVLFTSRDVLFPLLAASKRGFRKAPRIYANKSLAIVSKHEVVPVMLENCSLTGLAVFGEADRIRSFLDSRDRALPLKICLDRKTPDNVVTARLVALRNDGTHIRLGLSVRESSRMATFMRNLGGKNPNWVWRLKVVWNSSYFQRLAILVWMGSLFGSVVLPTFRQSQASNLTENRGEPNLENVESSPTGELEIEVDGFANDDGRLRLVIDNSSQTYKGNGFILADAPIRAGRSKYIFRNLPYGQYAVRLFHDENNNGKLDTNLVGIPVEAYGFSNNAREAFGAPTYEKTKFNFESEREKIAIRVEPHF